ncbi:hypothetical protein LG832_003649 [Acinetobacter baumannii]|uniref:hypothetical protein n=1 Tax=Acinetobacter baumannii TaxID=470 RepID=UPI0018972239|nr:hypothetical protein [Acinetobacter baumannii]EKV1658221.1 hypothetical protein [Acinetobacter baumannii]EKV1847132.1 hypothetical protein [Acinetobacter baumannii]EKV4645675.1 hypothetical protein [Acinetobacter baumannii]MBF6833682.1 hypothetical protein [Acinetobacter baumannii]MDK3064878.1 hypothetical protein [Acinetobacter baumannii]
MSYFKFKNPDQALHFYKLAERYKDMSDHILFPSDEGLPTRYMDTGQEPTEITLNKMPIWAVREVFNNYVKLRFQYVHTKQDWFRKSFNFFYNSIYYFISFIELIPNSTQLILFPKNLEKSIICARVNFDNSTYEINRSEIYFQPNEQKKFEFWLNDHWSKEVNNLDEYKTDYFNPIPARQLLAAALFYLPKWSFLPLYQLKSVVALISTKLLVLNKFEGRYCDQNVFSDPFLDIFAEKNIMISIKYLPYKNPLT